MLGICNGFQILCEAGLLPGVLMRNANLKFICPEVAPGRAHRHDLHRALPQGPGDRCLVAHGDGNYTATTKRSRALEGEGRVAFRYGDAGGASRAPPTPTARSNAIAGISQQRCNVLGMMPHPENLIETSTAAPTAAASSKAWSDPREGGLRRIALPGYRANVRQRCRTDIDITPELVAEHGLKPDEYERFLKLIGREPTLTELGIFSAMWNEHCSYKSSQTAPARRCRRRRRA